MKKIYIAKGYNSWTNNQIWQAFSTKNEADYFIQGLTDPHIVIMAYESTTQLVNTLLKGKL